METPLQPTSMGRVVFRSYGLYFRLFPKLIVTLLVIAAPLAILIFAAVYVTTEVSLPVGVILILVALVAFFAAFFYYYAVVTLIVSLRLTGAKAGVWQVFRRCSGKLAMQILDTGLSAGLRTLGALLLLIIPGLVLMVRYAFVQPVVVLERTSGRDALKRSKELASGHGWRIFGGIVLFQLVLYVVGFCIGFVGASGGLSDEEIRTLANLVGAVLFPASIIFPVLMYYDVRIRKEAINLETIREIV